MMCATVGRIVVFLHMDPVGKVGHTLDVVLGKDSGIHVGVVYTVCILKWAQCFLVEVE